MLHGSSELVYMPILLGGEADLYVNWFEVYLGNVMAYR